MRFIIHPEVKSGAAPALEWIRGFLDRFDTTRLGWLRIDLGREHRDRRGRLYRKYEGLYGRCWYPTDEQPTIRLSCQVPGPFPSDVVTRQKPVYRNPDGTWPSAAKRLRGPVYEDRKTGRQWKRVRAETRVLDLNEAVVWIFAHEAFHWLKWTRQIRGRDNEIEADAFADAQLDAFRQRALIKPHSRPGTSSTPVQGELFRCSID